MRFPIAPGIIAHTYIHIYIVCTRAVHTHKYALRSASVLSLVGGRAAVRHDERETNEEKVSGEETGEREKAKGRRRETERERERMRKKNETANEWDTERL